MVPIPTPAPVCVACPAEPDCPDVASLVWSVCGASVPGCPDVASPNPTPVCVACPAEPVGEDVASSVWSVFNVSIPDEGAETAEDLPDAVAEEALLDVAVPVVFSVDFAIDFAVLFAVDILLAVVGHFTCGKGGASMGTSALSSCQQMKLPYGSIHAFPGHPSVP